MVTLSTAPARGKVYGEGPSVGATDEPGRAGGAHHQAGAFNEGRRKPLTASEIRFTTKGKALYAFVMGRPEKEVTITALAPGGKHSVGKVQNVELLGGGGKLTWTQAASGLTVQVPAVASEHAVALKIIGA